MLVAESASAPSLLSFTVVAAMVTTAGTLLGLFLKETLLARSFETWRARRSLDSLHGKYRDPIVLAAIELATRLDEISAQYPTDFLDSQCLRGPPKTPNTTSERDAYFTRYKCQSTIYRFAALLGWLELYRQELVFFDLGQKSRTDAWEAALQSVREVLADGQLIETISDWPTWRDALIFREEQRAVGEVMIVQSGINRVVRGYGEFLKMLEDEREPNRWLNTVVNFLVDPSPPKDFRSVRLNLLLQRIIALVRALDRARVTDRLTEAESRAAKATRSAV